jgi:hypothetical protein
MSTARIRIPLFQNYQVTSDTDAVFGVFGPDTQGQGVLKTSGSSTTVTAGTAGREPFRGLTVGTEISVNRDGTRDVRYLATIDAGLDEATVDSAVNWEAGPQGSTGRAWHYRLFQSGQAATDGWFGVQEFESVTIQYELTTFNATDVTLYVEGRIKGPQSTPVSLVDPIVLTAVGEGFITIPEVVDEIRFGCLMDTDGGSNILNAYALCRPRARA